jgi:hypothetical protein
LSPEYRLVPDDTPMAAAVVADRVTGPDVRI